MANLRIKIKFLTLFIIGVFILSGCAKIKSSDKVIATVNGEPIYLKEFKRELALRVKQDPSFKISSDTFNELLEAMIDKKLIIQEAMKKRLAEKERFIDTIKTFWEQTLIRDFIDYKNEEIKNLLYVTDKEIGDYYERLKSKATFNIAKRIRREDINILMEKVKAGETIEWDTTVSLSYEEIPSETLSRAFELSTGEMALFEDGHMYYLIQVVNKEQISAPPLDEIYPRIKEKIKQRKQEEAFNEWLVSKRGKSNIKINTDILREIDK